MAAFFKEYGPGLVLVVFVGLISQALARTLIPNLGAVTLAIIIGLFISNVVVKGPGYLQGYQFAEKKLLPVAIVLLGTELQLRILIELGLPTLGLILSILIITMVTSVLIGRLLGFGRAMSLLMGAGNAICGSSAIAAVSPLVGSSDEDVGLSISTVNLLGTLGIFLIPLLVQLFRLDEISGGALIGGSLQAIGQVVAAGYSIDDATGNFALLVKMGRVLMLGPLALVIAWQKKTTPTHKGPKVRIPPFIIGFLVVSLITSWEIAPASLVGSVNTAGKWLLLLAMAGIGLKLRLETLLRQGPRALFFGLIVASLQLLLVLVFVYAVY